MARPQVADGGTASNMDGKCRVRWVPVTTAWRVLRLRIEGRPLIWMIAANILNKQSRTADKGWSSSLGGSARCCQLRIVKTGYVTKHEHLPRGWTDILVRPKQGKRDMKFGKMDLQDVGCEVVWTGSSWLRIGTGSGHL